MKIRITRGKINAPTRISLAFGQPVTAPAPQHTILADSPEAIAQQVASAFGMDLGAMRVHRRCHHLVWPRQIAMYLCRKFTKATYPQIAELLGRKDHATVMWGCRRVVERMETEPETREQIERLARQIQCA